MTDTLHSQVPFICGKSGQPFTAHFVKRPGDDRYRFVTNEIIPPDPGFLAGFFKRKAPPPREVSGLRDLADYSLPIFICPCCGLGRRPDKPAQSAFIRCGKCTALNCIGSLQNPEAKGSGQMFTCAGCGQGGTINGGIDALPSTDSRTNTPGSPRLSYEARKRLPRPSPPINLGLK